MQFVIFPIESFWNYWLSVLILLFYSKMHENMTWVQLQSLEDVTGAEFRMFMDFLKSLSIFGEKAPAERMKELIGIIEGQADLDAQFNVSAYFIVLTMGVC